MLSNVDGILYCQACKIEVNYEKTTTERHVQSERRVGLVARAKASEARMASAADTIHKWIEDSNARGTTLSDRTRVYRLSLLNALLDGGAPLTLVEAHLMKDFLHDYALGAVARTTLSDLIPCALAHEVNKTKEEIKGKEVMILFDGTTHVAECRCIIIRWINGDFTDDQRVVHFGFYKRAFRHPHIVAIMNRVIGLELQIDFRLVRAFQRDRAAVNTAAMTRLKGDFPLAEDLACLSHTLDNCGHNLHAPALQRFMNNWHGLFNKSGNVRDIWTDIAGHGFPQKSPTRWWSEYDCCVFMLEHEASITLFLAHDDHREEGTTIRSLRSDWQDVVTRCEILVQLSATVGIGKVFRDATYNLEGDGALALIAYDEIHAIEAARTTLFANMQYPATRNRVNQCAAQIAALHFAGNGGALPQIQQQLLANAQSVGEGAYRYFTTRIWDGALTSEVQLYKATKLCNPQSMRALQTTAATAAATLQRVRDMCDVDELIRELPTYKALADGMPPFEEQRCSLEQLTRFWQGYQARLPHWSSFTRRALLMQPSSAAPERAFSLLNNTFRDDRLHALQDYVASSVMIQYNENYRRR